MSICLDDDTNSTEQLDGNYAPDHDSSMEMHMDNTRDAQYGVDLNDDVDIQMDSDNEEEESGEEDDEKDEDEDEEKDGDEHNGKEPQMIAQGGMVNTLADDADSMLNTQPIILPKRGPGMSDCTPQLEPLAPTPWPETPEPRPPPQTPVTPPHSGLE